MSKAILVIDMPSKCEQCSFCQYGICHAKRKAITGTPKELKNKPDWCPLKPMPEKKSVPKEITLSGLGFIHGYNDCIDKILGGSEE